MFSLLQAKGQVRLQLCFIPSNAQDDPNRTAFAATAATTDLAAGVGIIGSKAARRAVRESPGQGSGQAS
jgi:hypothetical protein